MADALANVIAVFPSTDSARWIVARLFELFWLLTFTQPHTRPATVLIDEIDTAALQCVTNRVNCISRNWPS